MYSSNTNGHSASTPLQLIEKAQSYSEDDDLLSPYDTGEVERQMKRAWWKTCSLFTFLLATLGIIMFIIIRDNNSGSDNSDKNQLSINEKIRQFFVSDNEFETHTEIASAVGATSGISGASSSLSASPSLSQRGELPTSLAMNLVGSRVTLRKLFTPSAKHCVVSVMNAFVDNGDMGQDILTLASVENGFFNILDQFGSSAFKQSFTIQEYLTKSSEMGYYSTKLNKDFEIKTLTINAKSDAFVFVISINWEAMFGNKLPYITSKVVTMQYDYDDCEVTNLTPISFTECFNGKCEKVKEHESVVVSYLKTLVDTKRLE